MGSLGYNVVCIAVLSFDNNYLISREHSLVHFRSLHKCAHTRDMLLCDVWYLSHTKIAPTKSVVSFNANYVSHTRCVSHRKMWTEENMPWGVKSSIDKYSTTIKQIFTFDWPSRSHVLLHFLHCSWFIKLSAGQCMVRELPETKPAKWLPPKYSQEVRTENFVGR